MTLPTLSLHLVFLKNLCSVHFVCRRIVENVLGLEIVVIFGCIVLQLSYYLAGLYIFERKVREAKFGQEKPTQGSMDCVISTKAQERTAGRGQQYIVKIFQQF